MNQYFLLIIFIFFSNYSPAQWKENGIPVCDTSANKNFYIIAEIASDDSGGAYICWHDARGNDPFDIYAQHIDSDGTISWQKNGIPIAALQGTQQYPKIISDEKGGAFIAWEDGRGNDLYPYVQRIGKDGKELWMHNGVKASEQAGLFISLVNDKRGGVILAWSSVEDAFVQRLDSLGNRMWGDKGVHVTNRPETLNTGDIAITYDGYGGCIIAWAEEDTAYIQHADSSGALLWNTNGIMLKNPDKKFSGGVGIASDLSGGAIVIWTSWSSIEDTAKMYAQRISSSGEFLWSSHGILIGSTGHQPRITSDNESGAFIGRGNLIQHLDSLGNKLWQSEGVRFANSGIVYPEQTNNGLKGIWSFWSDDFDMYAQYIESNGDLVLDSNGVKFSDISKLAIRPKSISDGKGNVIVAWNALFADGTSTVYVAKLDTLGIVTNIVDYNYNFPGEFQMQQNFPNPFNPSTTIEFSLPVRSNVKLKIFNVLGEEVNELINKELDAGEHLIKWNAKNLSSGIYFYKIITDKIAITKKMILLR